MNLAHTQAHTHRSSMNSLAGAATSASSQHNHQFVQTDAHAPRIGGGFRGLLQPIHRSFLKATSTNSAATFRQRLLNALSTTSKQQNKQLPRMAITAEKLIRNEKLAPHTMTEMMRSLLISSHADHPFLKLLIDSVESAEPDYKKELTYRICLNYANRSQLERPELMDDVGRIALVDAHQASSRVLLERYRGDIPRLSDQQIYHLIYVAIEKSDAVLLDCLLPELSRLSENRKELMLTNAAEKTNLGFVASLMTVDGFSSSEIVEPAIHGSIRNDHLPLFKLLLGALPDISDKMIDGINELLYGDHQDIPIDHGPGDGFVWGYEPVSHDECAQFFQHHLVNSTDRLSRFIDAFGQTVMNTEEQKCEDQDPVAEVTQPIIALMRDLRCSNLHELVTKLEGHDRNHFQREVATDQLLDSMCRFAPDQERALKAIVRKIQEEDPFIQRSIDESAVARRLAISESHALLLSVYVKPRWEQSTAMQHSKAPFVEKNLVSHWSDSSLDTYTFPTKR